MNRLTQMNQFGVWDVPLRVEDDGAYIPSQEIIDRLAAYENTGLEPEAIRDNEEALAELEKAQSEGRLIVLPTVSKKDRESILEFYKECRLEWIHDPSVGLWGPNDDEAALMLAIEAALEKVVEE